MVTDTFPDIRHHCPVNGNKLHCLVTEVHVCEQLAYCLRLLCEAEQPEVKTYDLNLQT